MIAKNDFVERTINYFHVGSLKIAPDIPILSLKSIHAVNSNKSAFTKHSASNLKQRAVLVYDQCCW